MIGRQSLNKHKTINIIDFGLAKDYINPDTGKHIPFTDHKSLTGTARYMSITTHLGYEQSRRDDLEAIAHMLMYFLRGSLPWQGLKADTVKQRYNKIGEVKQATRVRELCGDYPEQFGRFLTYARNLEFSEQPNYRQQIVMFEQLMKSRGWALDWEFDWAKKREQEKKAEKLVNKPAVNSTNYGSGKSAKTPDARRRSSSIKRMNSTVKMNTQPKVTTYLKSSLQNNINRI